MTRTMSVILLWLGALPLLRAERPDPGPKHPFEETKTERFKLPPGATIRLNHSYGYLTVEGWDEPDVEVTIAKSTDRWEDPDWKEKAAQLFDQVRVATERRSDNELAISTKLPRRNSLLTTVLPSGRTVVTTPVPPNNKRGVTVEYTIHMPRDSRLVVHHDNGYVWVSGVTGDIDVNSHTGDIIVMLPDPGSYSVDARTRFGGLSSDLEGRTTRPLLVGTRFAYKSATQARRVHLRMGRGSITVKASPGPSQ